MVKPQAHSQQYSHTKQMKAAGEILNYPYSFDHETKDEDAIALDNQLAKQQYEEQYRLAEIQNQ